MWPEVKGNMVLLQCVVVYNIDAKPSCFVRTRIILVRNKKAIVRGPVNICINIRDDARLASTMDAEIFYWNERKKSYLIGANVKVK